jgi:hypothetical protein
MEIPTLSSDITNEHISMPYPHVRVLEPNDAIALILPELPTGDLPVVCEFNGTCRQIGSIRASATILNNLRKISAIEYYKVKGDSKLINSPLDAVEVLM